MGRCRLREEHEAARRLLGQLMAGEAVHDRLASTLGAHFRFEEEVLLPLLAERLPRNTGPLAVVREEHETLRALTESLAASAGDRDSPERDSPERDSPETDTSEARARLETLLLSHFEKEEELLLPFAHQALEPHERELLGCGAHGGTSTEQPR